MCSLLLAKIIFYLVTDSHYKFRYPEIDISVRSEHILKCISLPMSFSTHNNSYYFVNGEGKQFLWTPVGPGIKILRHM